MAGVKQASKSKTKAVMTDDAIKSRTGKDWTQWFKALDKAGAAKLDHKAIARLAREDMGAGPWYGQMIAVSYERARGIRAMNQKCDGQFSVSVTRVMQVPLPPNSLPPPQARSLVSQRRVRGDLAHQGQILAGKVERRAAGSGLLCQGSGQGADCAPIQQAGERRPGGKRACPLEEAMDSSSTSSKQRPDAGCSFPPGRRSRPIWPAPRRSSSPSAPPSSIVPTGFWERMRFARRSSDRRAGDEAASW